MAAAYIYFSDQVPHGRQLRQCLDLMEQSHRSLDDMLLLMAQMIDGDGSSSTHFPVVTQRFGFATDAAARAAWLELQSLASKFSTDASVTSVKSAMAQAFARLG